MLSKSRLEHRHTYVCTSVTSRLLKRLNEQRRKTYEYISINSNVIPLFTNGLWKYRALSVSLTELTPPFKRFVIWSTNKCREWIHFWSRMNTGPKPISSHRLQGTLKCKMQQPVDLLLKIGLFYPKQPVSETCCTFCDFEEEIGMLNHLQSFGSK